MLSSRNYVFPFIESICRFVFRYVCIPIQLNETDAKPTPKSGRNTLEHGFSFLSSGNAPNGKNSRLAGETEEETEREKLFQDSLENLKIIKERIIYSRFTGCLKP